MNDTQDGRNAAELASRPGGSRPRRRSSSRSASRSRRNQFTNTNAAGDGAGQRAAGTTSPGAPMSSAGPLRDAHVRRGRAGAVAAAPGGATHLRKPARAGWTAAVLRRRRRVGVGVRAGAMVARGSRDRDARSADRSLVSHARHDGLAMGAGGSAAEPGAEASRRRRNSSTGAGIRGSGWAARGNGASTGARGACGCRRGARARPRHAAAGHTVQPSRIRIVAPSRLGAADRRRRADPAVCHLAVGQRAGRLCARRRAARSTPKLQRPHGLGVVFGRRQPIRRHDHRRAFRRRRRSTAHVQRLWHVSRDGSVQPRGQV